MQSCCLSVLLESYWLDDQIYFQVGRYNQHSQVLGYDIRHNCVPNSASSIAPQTNSKLSRIFLSEHHSDFFFRISKPKPQPLTISTRAVLLNTVVNQSLLRKQNTLLTNNKSLTQSEPGNKVAPYLMNDIVLY